MKISNIRKTKKINNQEISQEAKNEKIKLQKPKKKKHLKATLFYCTCVCLLITKRSWKEARENKVDSKILNALFLKTETEKTLDKYSSYLEKFKLKDFTEDDLYMLYYNTNLDSCNLKLADGSYGRVNFEDYIVCEDKTKKELRLIPEFNMFKSEKITLSSNTYDLFTGQLLIESEEEYIEISNLGEFIKEMEVSPIGYSLSNSGWSDKDIQYMRKIFCGNEEYVNCIKENGFPLITYDVKDLKKVYKESLKEKGESRKLIQK